MAENCKTCKHSIFDEIWGDYKCKVNHLVIYNVDDVNDCVYYEKGKPKISKDNTYDKEVDE